jgi:hypothetical protein
VFDVLFVFGRVWCVGFCVCMSGLLVVFGVLVVSLSCWLCCQRCGWRCGGRAGKKKDEKIMSGQAKKRERERRGQHVSFYVLVFCVHACFWFAFMILLCFVPFVKKQICSTSPSGGNQVDGLPPASS